MHRIFSLGSLLLAANLCAVSSAQAEAHPKPVLTMIEYHGWGGIGYPLPHGLTLVAYDNGLIIQSARAHSSDQPAFVSAQRTPAEVSALADAAKAALQGVVSHERQPDGLPTDQGWTIIQYQDGNQSELVEVATYGLPCIAADGEMPRGFGPELRSAADPRFLQFCDALARKQFPNAQPWFPKEMWVFLRAQPERPDELIDWPSDWPKTWQESPDHKERVMCVPISEPLQEMTAKMLYPTSGPGTITAVEETKLAWWVIVGSEISMPGEIALQGDGGHRRLLSGPCSAAQSPE
jgi:hypothetical protein